MDIRALFISKTLRARIACHALEARPREAVGLLGGTEAGCVLRVLRLPNIAAGDRAFLADPFAQFCALRRLKAEGQALLAIYHSHPDGGAGLSKEDLMYARHWPCAHLIVSLRTSGSASLKLRAYRSNIEGGMENVELRLPSILCARDYL